MIGKWAGRGKFAGLGGRKVVQVTLQRQPDLFREASERCSLRRAHGVSFSFLFLLSALRGTWDIDTSIDSRHWGLALI